LLQAARARGLSTLAYVRTLEEARRAAAAGVEIVNMDFGWNMGGLVGVNSSVDLDEAATQAHHFVKVVRAISARTRCLIEGGPIVTPEQMDQVCRAARADGYVGGSTIDRVPLESAIEMTTNAFKTISRLRQQVEALERKLHRRSGVEALLGFSEAIERAREQTSQAMDSELPVLIVGESGTGRTSIARVIHEARAPPGRRLVLADCSREDVEDLLFGREARSGLLEQTRGSTLLLSNVEVLNIGLQRRLLRAAQTGAFRPKDAKDTIPFQVRLIGTCSLLPERTPIRQQWDATFCRWLGAIRIELPPLREHLEDLPLLAEAVLRGMAASEWKRIDPSAYRALLGYSWPGNLDDLRSVMHAAASATRGRVITDADVLRLLKSSPSSNRNSFATEREWIFDGLRRNRFRRAETAQFLRIARKTLYNKIRHYGSSAIESMPSARAKKRGVPKPA